VLRCAAFLVLLGASAATADELPPEQALARSRQIAAICHIESLLDRILFAPPPRSAAEAIAELRLHQQATEALLSVAMTIDATLARVEREQAEVTAVRDYFDSHHSASVTTWNIAAVLVGNAFSIAGSAMQFGGPRLQVAGDGIIIGGAAIAAVLGSIALLKKAKERPPYAIETNMLARLLGRTPVSGSDYPEEIWGYLDTRLVGERASIRNLLLEKWEREGRISLSDSADARRKIDLLTKPLTPTDRVKVGLLSDRAGMLADVDARVAAMNVDLQLLLRQVRLHD
jgi:hypothetical protein